MIELTEVMRQKDDMEYIQLLNKIRVGNVDEDVENKIKSRFIEKKKKDFHMMCYIHSLRINLSTNIRNSSFSALVVTLLKLIQLM